jgi:hypothetical protein
MAPLCDSPTCPIHHLGCTVSGAGAIRAVGGAQVEVFVADMSSLA